MSYALTVNDLPGLLGALVLLFVLLAIVVWGLRMKSPEAKPASSSPEVETPPSETSLVAEVQEEEYHLAEAA